MPLFKTLVKTWAKTLATLIAWVTINGFAFADATLDAVKHKGFIQCGVSQGLPGFSNPNDQGDWAGLDVDFCRAMAAAVFNDPEAVKFTPLAEKVAFSALASGEIDVLPRNTSWTMSRDTEFGEFVGVNYYDGQGFMIPDSLGAASALDLGGAEVCAISGTNTELNAAHYFRANNIDATITSFDKADEVIAAYESGRCNVYTSNRSVLAADRAKLSNPDGHILLPEIISKAPLGPMVRHGDSQWADIARWTLNCMINAEEAGVSTLNLQGMADSRVPDIKRLLGVAGELGVKMGLGNGFCANVIAGVGNYAESYNRNIGPDTPLKLDRGLNSLWSQGGVLFAPPMR